MQSKKRSFQESLVNMFTGILISYFAWRWIVIPWSGILGWGFYETNFGAITVVNVFFTLLSLIRGYLIRRAFNSLEKKPELKVMGAGSSKRISSYPPDPLIIELAKLNAKKKIDFNWIKELKA